MTDRRIGERLQKLHNQVPGLSIDELARIVGVSRGTVWKIENLPKANPLASTVERLARVLGCRVGWLAAGEGREPSTEAIVAAVTAASIAYAERTQQHTNAGDAPHGKG